MASLFKNSLPLSAAEVYLSHIASVLPESLYEICGYLRVLTHFYYNIPQSAIGQVTDIFVLYYSLWLRLPVEVGWDAEAKWWYKWLYLSFGLLLVGPLGIGNGLPRPIVVQRGCGGMRTSSSSSRGKDFWR